LLRATACTSNDAGLCNLSAPGVVDFTHKSEGGLIGSPLQLGTITFQADETEGTSALEIFVNLLRDPDEADITFAPPTNGEVVIQQLALKQGDADCNNSVNSVDALLVLRFGAGLGVNQNEACPEIGMVLTLAGVFGDVDCTGVVNSVDALKVLRHNAGLPVQQTEPCPDIGTPLASGSDKGDVSCSDGSTPWTRCSSSAPAARLPAALSRLSDHRRQRSIIGEAIRHSRSGSPVDSLA